MASSEGANSCTELLVTIEACILQYVYIGDQQIPAADQGFYVPLQVLCSASNHHSEGTEFNHCLQVYHRN